MGSCGWSNRVCGRDTLTLRTTVAVEVEVALEEPLSELERKHHSNQRVDEEEGRRDERLGR